MICNNIRYLIYLLCMAPVVSIERSGIPCHLLVVTVLAWAKNDFTHDCLFLYFHSFCFSIYLSNCPDISDTHRCEGGLKTKFVQWSDYHAIFRHAVGFFNMPVQTSTLGQIFDSYSDKPPISVAFYECMGIRMAYILLLNP